MYQNRKYGRGKELEHWFKRILSEMSRYFPIFTERLEAVRGKACQPSDFLIIYRSRNSYYLNVLYVDAKETDKVFYFSHKNTKRQIESMKFRIEKFKDDRVQYGFAIWFRNQDPHKQNIRLVTDFTKPATIESGTELLNFLDL